MHATLRVSPAVQLGLCGERRAKQRRQDYTVIEEAA